jgi:Cytochrome P460
MSTASIVRVFLGVSLLATVARGAGTEGAGGPSVDHVGFPKDYRATFKVLRTVVKKEEKKVVTIYGNAAAAGVTSATQRPYPYGSVIVMETAAADETNPEAASQKVLGLHVMRREKGFGSDYGARRSGEWEYVEYAADGHFLTPPGKSAACSECHVKAGEAKDYVFKGRFASEP